MNRAFVVFVCLIAVACGKQDAEIDKLSILSLKQMYCGYPLEIKDNVVVSGKIIADNSTTNLKGVIIVEDNTGAIEINIPYDYVSDYLNVGNQVEIYCQGLCLGGYGGVVEIGMASQDVDYETSAMDEVTLRRHIKIVDPSAEIQPVREQVTIAELDASKISRLVKIENLVVKPSGAQFTWCPYPGRPQNTYAYDENGDSIALRVYDYASFATSILPSGAIDVEGSVGYFNGFQLRLLEYRYYRYSQN